MNRVFTSNATTIPTFFGIGMIGSGQYFLGVLALALGMISLLRLIEHSLRDKNAQEKSAPGFGLVSAEKIVRTLSFYSQQMSSVFFACMFWMVQGDLRLLTTEHWKVGFQTALLGSTILTLIEISPSKFLLAGRLREFVVTSLIISMVDHFVHPSHFGGPYAEAIATGLTAVGINMSIDGLFELFSYFFRL